MRWFHVKHRRASLVSNREIAYGVEQPGVYDGILYWVDKDGLAFHRFSSSHMRRKAQPFIDEHNKQHIKSEKE